MAKLQAIESALIAVNEAVFQNLCDAYIFQMEPGYPSIHRPGSKMAKEKTKPGRPDSFFLNGEGKYVLIECTTQQDDVFGKIRKDLMGLLDPQIINISIDEVEKIIYCCNSPVSLTQHNELSNLCRQKGICLDLWDLGVLGIGISGRLANIARDYLGISIDTGQVLTIEQFINEYEASSYATSLQLPLVGREVEIQALENAILTRKVTIVTGPPGTGKTRLILFLLEKLRKNSNNLVGDQVGVACLSNKNAPIYEDLRTHLTVDKEWVVFIDDANRQSGNLDSVLPLLLENRERPLRLILSVRDYAEAEVRLKCSSCQPATVAIGKMSDDAIAKMVGTLPFEITDKLRVTRINEIADGNPRLAVMAAMLAVKGNGLDSLADVSDLYESYFSQALKQNVLADENMAKAVGLVSFFQYINRRDEAFCQRLFAIFNIREISFWEACQQLEKLELLEWSADLTVVKISEQTLGTYVFYKTFFGNAVLDFGLLLENYFGSRLSRIRDTIVPVTNIFGFSKMNEKLAPFLTSYWEKISADEEQAFKFIDVFWYCRMEETLGFLYRKMEELPSVEGDYGEPSSGIELKNAGQNTVLPNQSSPLPWQGREERCLGILQHFYPYPLPCLRDAIDLGFSCVRKRGNGYLMLVGHLKKSLEFRMEDEEYGYERQLTCCTYVADQVAVKDDLGLSIFFDLMPDLLKCTYQYSSMGKDRSTMMIHRYTLSLWEPTKTIRSTIWKTLNLAFEIDHTRSVNFIEQYIADNIDKGKDIFEFDVSMLVTIISKHFSERIFTHCWIANMVVFQASRRDIANDQFDNLKVRFSTPIYRIYQHLSWDWLDGNRDYQYELDHNEYEKRKRAEINGRFEFGNINEFKNFYQVFLELSNWSSKSGVDNFLPPFDFILERIFAADLLLGFDVLTEIMASGNLSGYVPGVSFAFIAKLQDDSLKIRIYHEILRHSFMEKPRWLYRCFEFLPAESILLPDSEAFLGVFGELKIYLYTLDTDLLNKFLKVVPSIYSELLETIYKRNDITKVAIRLGANFMIDIIELLPDHIGLVKQTYIQQRRENSFDHNFAVFLKIIGADRAFFFEYLDYLSRNMFWIAGQANLSVIWNLEYAMEIVREGMNVILANGSFSLHRELIYALFERMNEAQSKKGLDFLKAYMEEYVENEEKVNTVINCVRKFFPNHFEEIVLHFLKLSTDFSIFKAISWTRNSYTLPGGTIIGDIKKGELKQVLDIMEKISEKRYLYGLHFEWIKTAIAEATRRADIERKQRFISQD
jgi:hypothetical protein